jgi:hypothetical protein
MIRWRRAACRALSSSARRDARRMPCASRDVPALEPVRPRAGVADGGAAVEVPWTSAIFLKGAEPAPVRSCQALAGGRSTGAAGESIVCRRGARFWQCPHLSQQGTEAWKGFMSASPQICGMMGVLRNSGGSDVWISV